MGGFQQLDIHGPWGLGEDAEGEATATEGNQEIKKPEMEPEWILKWRAKADEDIKLHQEVLEKGCIPQ